METGSYVFCARHHSHYQWVDRLDQPRRELVDTTLYLREKGCVIFSVFAISSVQTAYATPIVPDKPAMIGFKIQPFTIICLFSPTQISSALHKNCPPYLIGISLDLECRRDRQLDPIENNREADSCNKYCCDDARR